MYLDYFETFLQAAESLQQQCGLAAEKQPPVVAATPARVVYRRNKAKVLHYQSSGAARLKTPVLLVPSFINQSYILDLTPGFSLVEHLLQQGHDVFMVNWGVAGDEDRLVGFDDMIDPMLDRVVRAVLRKTQQQKLALVGYCMGGTLCVAYTALHPERVESLVSMLAPIDFTKGGMLTEWVDPAHFDPALIIEAYGNMPPLLMQTGFQMMRPMAPLSKAMRSLQKEYAGEKPDAESERFFAALEYWAWDNIPFPGEAYSKYITALYQQNLLYENRLTIHGQSVLASNISCPVLTLYADKDHIVPPDCATALDDIIDSKVHDMVGIKGGHVAAVVGPRGRRELWPALSDWLGEHVD